MRGVECCGFQYNQKLQSNLKACAPCPADRKKVCKEVKGTTSCSRRYALDYINTSIDSITVEYSVYDWN